jgi:phosphoribosyl 1,2-cyclic phosphodiesterase
MKIRFLGTAAGGGAPQWNCGCRTCEAARDADVSRIQDGLAVSGDGDAWYLVNASPDLRAQLLATPGPRYLFTHLNNTNPLVVPDAPEPAEVAAAGAAVAVDGLLLEL